MGFFTALVKSVAGPLIGSGGSLLGSSVTEKKQRAEAQRNREFQKMMSDTAHQREVKDLKAAGLNPILSAGGQGASSATGAQANIPDYGDSLRSGATTGLSIALHRAQVRKAMAEAKVFHVHT